jgi:GNAT superfamily N-acetyltransferase
MVETEAVIATRAEVPAMAATLARALADDPGWIYIFPDAASRVREMTKMLRVMVGDAYVGLGATWMLPDARAAAVWMPPGRRHVSIGKQLVLAPRLAWRLRARTLRGIRMFAAMEQKAPKEPHAYLAILGVDPAHQGRGLGQRAIQPVLDACDADRTLAWLETANPANHGFYRRVGFERADAVDFAGGPTLTFFARAPR